MSKFFFHWVDEINQAHSKGVVQAAQEIINNQELRFQWAMDILDSIEKFAYKKIEDLSQIDQKLVNDCSQAMQKYKEIIEEAEKSGKLKNDITDEELVKMHMDARKITAHEPVPEFIEKAVDEVEEFP